jgi:mannose-6-phosphate isomerase-like protein (cupin superfamily)
MGAEVHDLDQVLVFVSGRGEYVLDGAKGQVGPGEVVVVPAGTKHNFITVGDEPMKLYTVYAPPEHPDGTIHKTKEEAEIAEAEEHGHPPPPPKGAPAVPRGLTVGSLLGK